MTAGRGTQLKSVRGTDGISRSARRDVRGARRRLLGDAQAVLRQGRAPPVRGLRLREDLLEGRTISLEELPVFRALLVPQVVEGRPRPSEPVEYIGQSEHRQQRRNRNQGTSVV